MPSVFCRNSAGNIEKQMYSSNGGDAHRSNSSSSSASFPSSSSFSSSPAWPKHVPANPAWEHNGGGGSSRQTGGYGSREKFERSDNRDRFFPKKDWNLSVDNRSSSSSSASSVSAPGSYRLSNGLPGPATKRRTIGRHGPIVENGRYVTTAAYRSTLDSSFSTLRSPPECKAERDSFDSSVVDRASSNKEVAGDDGHHHHFLSPPYSNPRFESAPRYESSHSSHRATYANGLSNDSCHRGGFVNNNPGGVDGRERSKINGSYAWDLAHRDRDRDNRTWARPDYYHRRASSLSKVESPFKESGVLDRGLGESRNERYGRESAILDDRDHPYVDREGRERNQPKGFPSWAESPPFYSTPHHKEDVAVAHGASDLREKAVATGSNSLHVKEEVVAATDKDLNLRDEVVVASLNTRMHHGEEGAAVSLASHGREDCITTISITPQLREKVARPSTSDPEVVSMSIVSPHRLPLSPLESLLLKDSSNSRSNNGENDSQKKRPRLTWGQGLAKYEKEKIEEDPSVSRKQQEGIQQEHPDNAAVDAMSDHVPNNIGLTCEGNWQQMTKNMDHNYQSVQEEQCNAGVGQRDSKEKPWDDLIVPSANTESTTRSLMDRIESSTASLSAGCEISVTSNGQSSVLLDVQIFLDNYQQERLNVSKEFLTQQLETVEHELDLLEKELFKLDCEAPAQLSGIRNTEQDVLLSPQKNTDKSVSLDPTEGTKLKDEQSSGKDIGKSHPMGKPEAEFEAIDLVMEEIINQVISTSGTPNVEGKAGECEEHGMPKIIDENSNVVSSILSLNQETAKGCWTALAHLNCPGMEAMFPNGKLVNCPQDVGVWKLNAENHEKNKVFLQSKISEEKRSIRFMERVLAFKYKACREVWKQDQASNLLQKDCGEKTLPQNLLSQQSIGIPCSGIVSSLLNPWTGYEREYLKMPSMLPRNTARSWHCFETKNAIVENPIAAEMERKLMNPWSAEERKIFLDKYALLGKDFRKIASFLEYKSVADCIEFYYKNQKHEEFQKIHKRHQLKKRRDSRASGLYLATTTSASTRHREANHACMEGLTLVAAAAAAISAPRKSTDVNSSSKGCRERYSERHPTNLTIMPFVKGSNKDQAGIKGSRSSIRPQQLRRAQEESDSHWTDGERDLFLEALTMFGKDFNSICRHVGTKNTRQCKSFFSKARRRLGLDQVVESHNKMVIQSASESCEVSTHKIVETNPQIIDDMKPQFIGLDQVAQNHKTVIRRAKENCEVSVPFSTGMKPHKFSHMKPQRFEDGKQQKFEVMKPQSFEDVKFERSELINPGGLGDVEVQTLEGIKVESHLQNGIYDSVEQNAVELPTAVEASMSGRKVEMQSSMFEEAHLDPQGVTDVNSLKALGDPKDTTMSLNKASGVLAENLKEEACLESGGEDCSKSRTSHSDEAAQKLIKDNHMATTVEDSSTLISENKVTSSTSLTASVSVVKNPNLKEMKTRREPTSWTPEEKATFSDVLKVYGKSWDRLRESLPSKSLTQIKTYFQNSKAKLGFGPGLDGTLNGSETGRVVMPKRKRIDDSDLSNNQVSGGQSPLSRASVLSDDPSLNRIATVLAHSEGITGSNAESMAYVNFISRSPQQEGFPNCQQASVNTVGVVANSMFNPTVCATSNSQQSQLSSPAESVPLPQVATSSAAFPQQQGIVDRVNQNVSALVIQPPELQTTKHMQVIVHPQVTEPKTIQSELEIRPQLLQVERQVMNNHLQQASVPALPNSSMHRTAGFSQLGYLPIGNPHAMSKHHQTAQIQQLQILPCHRQEQQQLALPGVHQVPRLTHHRTSPHHNEQQQHVVKGVLQLSSSGSNGETLPCEGGLRAAERVENAEDIHSVGQSQASGDVKLFGQSLLLQPSGRNQQSTCQQLNNLVCSMPPAEGSFPLNFSSENITTDENMSVPSQVSSYGVVHKQELLSSKQIPCPSIPLSSGADHIQESVSGVDEGEHRSLQALDASISDNLVREAPSKDYGQTTQSVLFSQQMVKSISDQSSSAEISAKLAPQPSNTTALVCDVTTSEHIATCTELKKIREQDLCSTGRGVDAVPSHGLPRVLSALVALAEWRLQNANGGSNGRLTDEFLNQSWEALQRDPGALVEAGKVRGVLPHLNSVRLEESSTADVTRNVDGKTGGGAAGI